MEADRKAPVVGEEPVDVLIVTAVIEEYLAVLDVDTGAVPKSEWAVRPGPTRLDVAFRTFLSHHSRPIRVAATRALAMGGVAAANAAAPLVFAYRPRCIAMCGVCAGRRNEVNLGDVIVGDRLWTYDTGKTVVERDEATGKDVERFKADPFQHNLDPVWLQKAEQFKPDPAALWLATRPRSYDAQMDWLLARVVAGGDPREHPDMEARCADYAKVVTMLRGRGWLAKRKLEATAKGRKRIEDLRALNKKGLPEPEEPAPFKVHVAPIGTGTAVVQNVRIFDELSVHMRKVLGLEMEAAAIGAIAELHDVERMIVMKGVMDHADPKKNDNFKGFAARASAECLMAFLRAHLFPENDAVDRKGNEAATKSQDLLQQLLALGFVRMLAHIFGTQNKAEHILRSANIGETTLPSFSARGNAEMYWSEVCRELFLGNIAGNLDALAAAALTAYPGNGVFQAAARAARA